MIIHQDLANNLLNFALKVQPSIWNESDVARGIESPEIVFRLLEVPSELWELWPMLAPETRLFAYLYLRWYEHYVEKLADHASDLD